MAELPKEESFGMPGLFILLCIPGHGGKTLKKKTLNLGNSKRLQESFGIRRGVVVKYDRVERTLAS